MAQLDITLINPFYLWYIRELFYHFKVLNIKFISTKEFCLIKWKVILNLVDELQ